MMLANLVGNHGAASDCGWPKRRHLGSIVVGMLKQIRRTLDGLGIEAQAVFHWLFTIRRFLAII
jgi:hypothetical protein